MQQNDSKNLDNNTPENLSDYELKRFIEYYYANSMDYLTPYAIICLLIAFSPSVAKHISETTGANSMALKNELKNALDAFLESYADVAYMGELDEAEAELDINYSEILNADGDVKRLLACYKQRNYNFMTYDDDLLVEYCNPVLKKHNISFQTLFPDEFEKAKKEFVFDVPGKKQKDISKSNDNFGTDLTEKAAKLDTMPVFYRDEEIRLIENLLLKQNRSNVMLVGKNGTGKSVLIDGLAYNIVNNLSHPLLRNTKIISVNFGNLMSDTMLRGQLEKKLTTLMDNISANNWILFLDEAHTLFSGRGQEDNIANIMKPYLADGKVRVIAATTDKEFMAIRDGALLRRFNQVKISEPNSKMTMDILKKLKPKYESAYSISIPDDVLADVVKKSELYVHNRNFPDKAIDLLNYACVLACGKENSKVCGTNSVNKALMDMFNIPLELLNTSEAAKFSSLKDKLNNTVFGQDAAISAVSETLAHSYVIPRKNNNNTPQASFLFCGPSGVGKTKTAEEIAKLLGRGFKAINMNEYQNDMDVQKLTGAAPGYVGYESGGLLTNAIAENPYSVLLFDEFEKAHRNVQRLLLQILDKGTFTDNQGMEQNFKNAIIIMATNAGLQKRCSVGFNETNNKLSVSREALAKAFMPEFLGRVNKIVSFEPLNDAALKGIVNSLCYELNASMEQNYNISTSVTPALQEHVIKKGFRPELGARNINNTFLQEVEIPVACQIANNIDAFNNAKTKRKMLIDFIDGKVRCKTTRKTK